MDVVAETTYDGWYGVVDDYGGYVLMSMRVVVMIVMVMLAMPTMGMLLIMLLTVTTVCCDGDCVYDHGDAAYGNCGGWYVYAGDGYAGDMCGIALLIIMLMLVV